MARSFAVLVALLAAAPAAWADGPRVELGVEERVRSEAQSNLADHDAQAGDARTWFRFRTRAWVKANFAERFELNLTLGNESRKTTRPDTPYKWDEVVVENFYLDWRANEHVALRAGRQGLMRGEGFVLADGTALDGSRTQYFNGFVASASWRASRLELIALSEPWRDIYLPRLNENAYGPRTLGERDERAVGLYYTDRNLRATTLEGYLFRKTETGDARPATSAAFQPDRAFAIAGARVAEQLGRGWSLAGEFAYEWGTQDANPARATARQRIAAWGGYSHVTKSFAVPSAPTLRAGLVALSGDDPSTGTIEGWDPLFARWPKYSELYIYALVGEQGVAYWTNLRMWLAELQLAPCKPLTLRATWYRMDAFHSHAGSPAIFGGSTTRGDLWQARADLAFAPHWKMHALYERLEPGDFYAHRDAGYFLRFEVTYTASVRWGGGSGRAARD